MFLHKLKLKYKLLLIIAVVALTISSFAALSFSYAVAQYNQLLYRQTSKSLSSFSRELDHKLNALNETSSVIAFSDSFQEGVERLNREKSVTLETQRALATINTLLYRYYESGSMSQITLFTPEHPPVSWGATKLNESESYLQRIFDVCDQEQGRPVWFPSETSTDLICARRVLKARNLSLNPLGYLLIGVDLAQLVDNIIEENFADKDAFRIYLSTADRLVYASVPDAAKDRQFPDFSGSYTIRNIGGEQMFLTKTPLTLGNQSWTLSLAISYESIFHSLNLIVPLFLFSLLLALVLALALTGSIVRNITLQFNALVGKMNLIRQEGIMDTRLSPAAPSDSLDEMSMLNNYFDQMVVDLKRLIEESYVKQLLITQAELKALEQQINPHFLSNTLYTIRWLAKRAGADEISTIADSLANLLQKTLRNKDTTIPIRTELEIVDNYLTIQQIRFEDLDVRRQIDTDCCETLIPKMTIQPLIENAIVHAQEEPQETYLISLEVRRQTDSVLIRVANSGPPIDPDILCHLADGSVVPRGNGIGLSNIDARLRIVFGPEHGLHFENADGMAVVWFEVPLQET